MKLLDYILHLQYLHSKCGDVDVDVNIKTTYEYMGADGFEYNDGYTEAIKPFYDKNKNVLLYMKNVYPLIREI